MVDRLRIPFFLIALLASLVIVLIEIGASLFLGGKDATASMLAVASEFDVGVSGGSAKEPPGRALPYLALVDGILLFTIAMMGAALIVPHRLHGRAQGVVTLIFSIFIITTALVLLVIAIVEVITMIVLFFAVPFGTIAYLIIWGSFPRGTAAALLSLLMFLKVVVAVMLALAHQRFIQNKGLVLLIATSIVANLIVAFLHGLVPRILVSITDDIAGIVLAVIAIIWAIVLLIGSIPAIVKAVRSTARLARGVS